jgi:hypothetical protein
MLIITKKKKITIHHSTCPVHKRHPGANYAGCTCSSSYELRDDPHNQPFEIEGFLEPPLKNPTAHRSGYVCDQGHYGSVTCSHCGENVEDEFNTCPGCGRTLTHTVWNQ